MYFFVSVQQCLCSVGPVFVNSVVPEPVPSSTVNQGSMITQTVYGFLDFTTTIGNTVMVFSPQSAAAAAPGKLHSILFIVFFDTNKIQYFVYFAGSRENYTQRNNRISYKS